MRLRIFLTTCLLFTCVFLIYYSYPNPTKVWAFVHKTTFDSLITFSSDVQAHVLYTGFKSSSVGPATISIILTGVTPFNKTEFLQILQKFSGKNINSYDSDANGIYKLLAFDTTCKWSLNGVTSIGDLTTRSKPEASHYGFTINNDQKVDVYFYPTSQDDLVLCDSKRVIGNLYTIKIETFKRYPF